MRTWLLYAKRRMKLFLLISIVLASAVEVVAEYALTNALVGWPTVVFGVGGLVIVWVLLAWYDDKPSEPSSSPSSENTHQVASRSGSLATNDLEVKPPSPLATNDLEVKPPSPLLPEDRYPPYRICQRSPEQLVDAIKGATSTAAARIVEPYLGQLLNVSGNVRNVSPKSTTNGSVYVAIELNGTSVDVIAVFKDGPWDQWLDSAAIGDPISVIGEITKVEAFLGGTVTLRDCEVLTH